MQHLLVKGTAKQATARAIAQRNANHETSRRKNPTKTQHAEERPFGPTEIVGPSLASLGTSRTTAQGDAEERQLEICGEMLASRMERKNLLHSACAGCSA
jgi:hypothetical protein